MAGKATKNVVSARQILPDSQISSEDLINEKITPEERVARVLQKKGAKQLIDKKPKGASRFLYEAPIKTSRPVSIYLERITDSESGKVGVYMWHTTEDSKTIGREEIVRINPRTDETFTLGYDYTIPFKPKDLQELLEDASSKTKVYRKDGNRRDFLTEEALNEIFTPKPKTKPKP